MVLSQLVSKFEINIQEFENVNFNSLAEFVAKNKIYAIVSDPKHIQTLLLSRAVVNGTYKIISTIDFPEGNNVGVYKFIRENPNCVNADGYEILLSCGDNDLESYNEIKSLHSYIKSYKPFAEIRWVLKFFSADRKNIINVLNHLKKFPVPLIRLDPHLVTQQATLDALCDAVELIKEHVPYNIKISGNVDLDIIDELSKYNNVKRFDISFKHANNLIKNLQNRATTNNSQNW